MSEELCEMPCNKCSAVQIFVFDRLVEDDGVRGDEYGPFDPLTIKEERERLAADKAISMLPVTPFLVISLWNHAADVGNAVEPASLMLGGKFVYGSTVPTKGLPLGLSCELVDVCMATVTMKKKS